MIRPAFSQLVLCVSLAQVASIAQIAKSDSLPPGDQEFECDATPPLIMPGGVVKITVKPLRSDLFYAFGSSAGTLTVTGNSALLNTAGVKTPIIVICSAVDHNGRTVQATITVGEDRPPPPPPQQPAPTPAATSVREVNFDETPPRERFTPGAAIAPSLSWTTGTQTQTILGGSLLVSDVRTTSYCDPKLIQIGMAANASDTATTKLTGPTTDLDNNELSFNATRAAFSRENKTEADRIRQVDPNLQYLTIPQYANSYIGVDANFFGNNSLGLGLQQTYSAQFQYYLTKCSDASANAADTDKSAKTQKSRLFASVGIGAGYVDQRLYKTQNDLTGAVLPLSAQFSYLKSSATGIPPKFIVYGLVGFTPILTDLHAYQVGATAGLQIPAAIRWMTVNLTETDLYMNNAPSGFKRNYQNGTISLSFSFPPPPAKIPNLALPESAKGSCYGGDKLARLYCYDDVTADACAPPSIFRAKQHCASAGVGTNEDLLHQMQMLQQNQQQQ